MQAAPVVAKQGFSAMQGLIIVLLILLGLVAVYFLGRFLYGSGGIESATLVGSEIDASKPPATIPAPPAIFEGGDISVSFWTYITGWKKNLGRKKHIFEIGGDNFSSLLIGLGGFKNSLIVRTHTRSDIGANVAGTSTGSTVITAGSTSPDLTLTRGDVESLFAPMSMDDAQGGLANQPMCDLPEIDLQRWVHVCVVMSGKVIDVYLDGKLKRSCTLRSYFKVDTASEIRAKILQRDGYEGYLASLVVSNRAFSPDRVYKLYMNGPSGASTDPTRWFQRLFTGR